jgi:uncharacterized protein (TIGR03437 family)
MMKALFILLFVAALPHTVSAQVNVLTANYDNNRTNANMAETLLNVSNVNPAQFGKLYSLPVDGQVYAQPLYVSRVNLPVVGARNVLLVATMHNTVYAFDADGGAGVAPLWQVNLGPPVQSVAFGAAFTDILDEIGILGTPVVDPAAGIIYVVNQTAQGANIAFYLHALDLATGAERLNSPVLIQASFAGHGWGGLETPISGMLPLLAEDHLQRPGLLLANGNVYIAFGSHADTPPWHGWLVGYDASTLKQTVVFNATPSVGGGAIWQSGRGVAADSDGNLFFSTGNGTFNGETDWGESVVKLSPTGSVLDWFTPSDWSDLNDRDADFGSGGPILVPNSDLVISGGKEGVVALLRRADMGHVVTANTQIVQSFQATDSGSVGIFNSALWPVSGGAFFYVLGRNDPLRAYRMSNGVFKTTAVAVNTEVPNALPYAGFTVSSNGSLPPSGILWVTTTNTTKLPAPGTLYALSATNVADEIWNSDASGARDTLGGFSKFANPTVANGKVFAPTASKEIVVYGLLPDVPGVASIVNAASFRNAAVSPGELITIFGNSIGPSTGVQAPVKQGDKQFPFELQGVSLTFDGQPAPLLYAGPGQINAVVPFGVSGSSTRMVLKTPNHGSFPVQVPVAPTAPAFFTWDRSGSGAGAILHNTDFSPVTSANPALRGTYLAIYVTGTGATTPGDADGEIAAPDSLSTVALPVTVTIGGQNAPVVYQGDAAGLIAGLTQLNVQVPDSVEPGTAVPVTFSVGGVPSQNTVTIAVQ